MCTEERKPHKHAALIKAWADGAIIQFKDIYGVWTDTHRNRPSWHEDSEYRIKPALVKSVGYRRCLYNGPGNQLHVRAVSARDDTPISAVEGWGVFVQWIDTEWQYETVEVK